MEVGRSVGDGPQVSDLTSKRRVGNRDGDGLLVHIKSDESMCGVHGIPREL
jgi:hypothetical protein